MSVFQAFMSYKSLVWIVRFHVYVQKWGGVTVTNQQVQVQTNNSLYHK